MHRRPKVKSIPKPITAQKPKPKESAQLNCVAGTSTSANGPLTTTAASDSQDTASNDDSMRQQFEMELCWCIQTLENSLVSSGGKLSEKQGNLGSSFQCSPQALG